jgi:hypothetical protein
MARNKIVPVPIDTHNLRDHDNRGTTVLAGPQSRFTLKSDDSRALGSEGCRDWALPYGTSPGQLCVTETGRGGMCRRFNSRPSRGIEVQHALTGSALRFVTGMTKY